MAIQRLTLANILTLVRIGLGEADAAASKISDANLITLINAYGQLVPSRAGSVMRRNGLAVGQGTIRFKCWRTEGTCSADSSAQYVWTPTDFDTAIEFNTLNRPLEIIKDTRQLRELRDDTGPASHIMPLEWGTNAANSDAYQRKWKLFPSPQTAETVSVLYYKLPAIMPGDDTGAEYPDCDPKFHYLWVCGTLRELLRPDDPTYELWKKQEEDLIIDFTHSEGIF
jgi:hypothetical protein